MESNCLISFAPVFSCTFMYCWVLIFVLSLFYILILCTWRWYIDKLGSFMQTENLCVLIYIRKVRLVPLNMLSPPVIFIADHSKAVLVLCILFVIYVSCCLYYAVCLLLAAFWSHAGKGLISWLSCVLCFCVFCHFPIWGSGLGVVRGPSNK